MGNRKKSDAAKNSGHSIGQFFDRLRKQISTGSSAGDENNTRDMQDGQSPQRYFDGPSYSADSMFNSMRIKLPFKISKKQIQNNTEEKAAAIPIRQPKPWNALKIENTVKEPQVDPKQDKPAGRTLKPTAAAAALAHLTSEENKKRYGTIDGAVSAAPVTAEQPVLTPVSRTPSLAGEPAPVVEALSLKSVPRNLSNRTKRIVLYLCNKAKLNAGKPFARKVHNVPKLGAGSTAGKARGVDTRLAKQWSEFEYNSLFTLSDEALFYGRDAAELSEINNVPPPPPIDLCETPSGNYIPTFRAETAKTTGTEPIDLETFKEEDQPKNSLASLLPENALKIIAQHSETPANILAWLAKHSNPHVRSAVAKNPSVPYDVLVELSKDEEAGIRNAIAENPATCREVLELVSYDKNPLIAWRAQQTLSAVDELVRSVNQPDEKVSKTEQRGDQNQTETEEQIEDQIENQDPDPISNQIVEPEPFGEQVYLGDSDEAADMELYGDDCSTELDAELVSQPLTEGGEFAGETTIEINSYSYVPMEEEEIQFLLVVAKKTNTPLQRLTELSQHPEARIRSAVAENANTPIDRLWVLARDRDSAVRMKVIDNYNCPIEILEALKEDENAYVAYQAHTALLRILGAAYGDGSALRTVTWP